MGMEAMEATAAMVPTAEAMDNLPRHREGVVVEHLRLPMGHPQEGGGVADIDFQIRFLSIRLVDVELCNYNCLSYKM